MEKIIDYKKWLRFFTIGVLIFIIFVFTTVYIIDPYFQYRVRDNRYFLNIWYSSAGLVKNYDYNSLILGSSMTQNFDMNLFRNELGIEPLHIGIGGMRNSEMLELIELANTQSKVKNYYLCIDLFNFTSNDESRLKRYLFNNDIVSGLRYSLSYEAWMRLMPIDIILTLATELGKEIPYTIKNNMNIDRMGNWNDNTEFGEKVVLEKYNKSLFAVSKVDLTNLSERMRENVDYFFDKLKAKESKVILFFPPYSALYWLNSEKEGYLESYLRTKEYFISKALSLGYNVYDFQATELTLDLNNYTDTTHYKQDLNDWMVVCFARQENKLDKNSLRKYEYKLRQNIKKFKIIFNKLENKYVKYIE